MSWLTRSEPPLLPRAAVQLQPLLAVDVANRRLAVEGYTPKGRRRAVGSSGFLDRHFYLSAVLAGAVTRLIAGTLVQLLVAHRGGRPALAPILHLTLLGAVIGGVINAGWYRWLDAAIERWRVSVSILPPHEPGQPPTTREVSAARTD